MPAPSLSQAPSPLTVTSAVTGSATAASSRAARMTDLGHIGEVQVLRHEQEGLLPHGRSARHADRSVEEERRLCYVGMTRARERLVLCHAKSRRRRGVFAVSTPSRFLAEIPLSVTEGSRTASQSSEEQEQALARDFFRGMRELLR